MGVNANQVGPSKIFSTKDCGPTFLGIGIQKAGTTWLDNNLRQHPEISMPPLKELHFFDDLEFGEETGDFSRYFSAHGHIRNRWRRYFKSEILRCLRYPGVSGFRWTIDFLFKKRTFDWYRNLFPGTTGPRGEISPEYCFVNSNMINRIHTAFPDLRIIILLRNPIDRAWSHAKMELIWRTGRNAEELSEDEFLKFLSKKSVVVKSRYTALLENWLSVFPKEQIFIGLFDDIRDRPFELLEDVLNFVGADAEWRPDSELLTKKAMEGVRFPIPKSIENYLRITYKQDIQTIADLFPERDLLRQW